MSGKYASLAISVALALTALVGAPTPGHGQVYIGAQGSWGNETDLGVGGRVLGNIENANLEMVGSFDIYFPDVGDYWEANANLFYHFHLRETPSVLPYVGGGLNLASIGNGDSTTEAGLNLGGGLRFPLENVSPFIEAKTVLSDFDQSVLTFGLVFGHAHGGS